MKYPATVDMNGGDLGAPEEMTWPEEIGDAVGAAALKLIRDENWPAGSNRRVYGLKIGNVAKSGRRVPVEDMEAMLGRLELPPGVDYYRVAYTNQRFFDLYDSATFNPKAARLLYLVREPV